MLQQVDVICKNEFSIEESAELAQDMLRVLHRLPDGTAGYFYYSTPTDGGGYRQDWRKIGAGYQDPKYQWVDNLHVYFSFNPHREIPQTNAAGEKRDPRWVRGTERNIVAINALFCDADAKDYITQDEWMPFYVEPNVDGMSKQQTYGALQKAETAAVDAALVASTEAFEEYKRRALAAIMAAPVPPTYLWCSGGGWQAAWALDKPLVLTDDNFANVKRVVKAWVTLLGADPGASDLNRILRLPGTVNRKKKYGPQGHQVCFTVYVPDRTYTFEQLAAFVADVQDDTAPVRGRAVYVPVGWHGDMAGIGEVVKLPRHPAIAMYNASTNQHDLLFSYGYADAAGGRMVRPGGARSGVRLNDDNTSNHFDSADPLYGEHRITPAHVLCAFEYGGSVDKMLAGLTGCDRPLPNMTAEMAYELRAFAQSAEARAFLRDAGVRRPEGYTRTAEALIAVAERAEGWLVTPGGRLLGEICNASHETERKHITALNGTWWQVWPQDDGADIIDLGLFYWASVAAGGYAKVDKVLPGVDIATKGVNFSVSPTENDAANTHDTVDPVDPVIFQRSVLPHDAFITTAYRHGIARRLTIKTGRGFCVVSGKRSGLLTEAESKRRKRPSLDNFSTVLLPGLGHVARPALAAIMAAPGITRQEIADMYGLSVRTLSKVLAGIERLQVSTWVPCTNDDGTPGEMRSTMRVVDVTEDAYGTKQYTATKDAMRVINTLLPAMTTYMSNTRRAHTNACARAEWLNQEYAQAAYEYKRRIGDFIERSYDAETPADVAVAAAVAVRLGVAALVPGSVRKSYHGALLAGIERRMVRNDETEHQLRAQLLAAGIKPAGSMPKTWIRWDEAEIATVRSELLKLMDEIDTWADDGERLTFERKLAYCKRAGYTEDEIRQAMFIRRQAERSPMSVSPEEMPDAYTLFAGDDDGINAQVQYVHDGDNWVVPTEESEHQVAQAQPVDWRSQYKQVLTLGGDTFYVQHTHGAWEQVDAAGKPVFMGVAA